MAPRVAATLAALALATATAPAGAYCFSAACDEGEQSQLCDGDALPRGGCTPLAWSSGCVGFSVNAAGSGRVDAATAELLVELAFDAWRVARCGDGGPGIVVQNLGAVECGKVEYNKDAGNANVVVFRDDGWPHPDTGHNIALTTTTFDPRSGELLDADIELNSASYELSITDDDVAFDLLAVLTHEAGHFLGLSHSELAEATMYASYEPGTTDIRTLEPDDETAICLLYPPVAGLDEGCNPLPRHGFSPYCRGEQPEGDCAASGRAVPPGVGAISLAVALGASLARRRRRTRGEEASSMPASELELRAGAADEARDRSAHLELQGEALRR
jgi:hypothetical protein